MNHQPRKSLLDILGWRLRKRPRTPLPAPATPRPFQAVSIFCVGIACPVARRIRDQRFLARQAPPLPLTGCAHPQACECRYVKHKDRRVERRRFAEFRGIGPELVEERRRKPGRRAGD